MKLSSVLAIYLLFWVLCFFLVIPFGVRTDEEVGVERAAGHAESAPHRFNCPRAALIAAVLAADRSAPVAYLGSGHHGLYVLLAARTDVVKLASASELSVWSAANPGGLLLIESADRPASMPAELVRVAQDTVRRSPIEIWRAGA